MPGRRRFPRPLAALLVAATLLSLGWILFMPALQGPDETGHVAYVQYLDENAHGPTSGETPGVSQSLELQALIYWHNLASVLGSSTGRPGWTPAEQQGYERAQRHARRDDGQGPNALAQHPPAYYVYDAVSYTLGAGWQLPARQQLKRMVFLS